MRRALLIALPLVAMLWGLSQPVLAQAPDAKSTDLTIELKKKRTVVTPPADTGAGASEAEAAVRRMEELRRAEELQRKAMPTTPPQRDESVVEGIQGKQLPELPKR